MRSRGPKKSEHYPRSLPFDRLDVMHAAAVPRVPFPGTVRRRPDLAQHRENCALIIEHREQQQAKNEAANRGGPPYASVELYEPQFAQWIRMP
jgi:hypothetical protein